MGVVHWFTDGQESGIRNFLSLQIVLVLRSRSMHRFIPVSVGDSEQVNDTTILLFELC